MIVRGTPITFSLTLNWRDSDSADAARVVEAYKGAAIDVLARVNANVLQGKT
jgi:hypothetical protein